MNYLSVPPLDDFRYTPKQSLRFLFAILDSNQYLSMLKIDAFSIWLIAITYHDVLLQ